MRQGRGRECFCCTGDRRHLCISSTVSCSWVLGIRNCLKSEVWVLLSPSKLVMLPALGNWTNWENPWEFLASEHLSTVEEA